MNVFARDVIERVVFTYLESFVGLLLASQTPGFNIGAVQAAAVSALPAALATLKALFASKVGNPESASLSSGVGPID